MLLKKSMPGVLLVLCIFKTCIHAAEATTLRLPYSITVSGTRDLEVFRSLNLDIANVRKRVATVYLSAEERLEVEQLGYNCTASEVVTWTVETGAKSKPLSYPSYDSMAVEMAQLAATYPEICHLESAGQSVDDRDLWWLRISDNASTVEAEPSICLIGTMHGNEPLGMALLMELIRELTGGYGMNDRMTALIDQCDIRIMPLMNPDGYEAETRYNANATDLNRDFPDARKEMPDLWDDTDGRQPETCAVMAWLSDQRPTVSANFHTGSLVVNYPFDYTYSLSPDDGLFQEISLAYAENNPDMAASEEFSQGIVRGAVWYTADGTLQDWAYLATGELHVTVETSYDYAPEPDDLAGYWNDNKEAILSYMETVHTGIGGRVADETSGEPVEAWIRIEGNDHLVFSHPSTGYYHRLLTEGTYTVTAGAPGYQSVTQSQVSVSTGAVTPLDFALAEDVSENYDMPGNWPDKNDSGEDDDSADDSGGDGTGNSGTEVGGSSGGGCFIESLQMECF